MKRATVIAHEHIRDTVRSGDSVIDATVGNGHDTLFLAELVGEKGRVTGFDIQVAALASAKARLEDAGVSERVTLVHASHAELASHLASPVAAIMFNLGYLPGGDQEKITQSVSTLAALDSSLALLRPGGVLTCVCYPGHLGGLEEAEAVLAWSDQLSSVTFCVETHNEKGRLEGRPLLVSIWRSV